MQTLNIHQLVGQKLGHYQVEHLLGQSQGGAAYLARHDVQGQRNMLTVLNFPEGFPIQQWGAQFVQEASKLVRLSHPNVLSISDFGLQQGYVYLIIDFVKDPSLAQALRDSGPLNVQQIVPILKQISAGLDYTHNRGIVHGMLSPSHIVVNQNMAVRVAGFGLRNLLEVQRNLRPTRQWDHLFSANETFLGNPAYISPEQVLGQSIDGRADIYTLGVILYELLSGAPPFDGTDPLEVAAQRLQRPVPPIHTRQPQVMEDFERILQKMLEVEPARRYQYAGEAALDFERVLALMNTAKRASVPRPAPQPMTLPPTSTWFDTSDMLPNNEPPVKTPGGPVGQNAHSLAGIDPFEWWSSQASGATPAVKQAGTLNSKKAHAKANARPRSHAVNHRRRRVVVSLSAATAASVLTVAGISFAHLVQSMNQSQSLTASMSGNTATQGSHTPTGTTPAPQPTKGATSTTTHTGTVIGSTTLAKNSSHTFNNPKDGVSSLLIRLANGDFVACERTCTHQGVPVNYDTTTGMIQCPAHGAIFNPQNGFSHVSGPGAGPLTAVKFQANNDGTITV